MLKIRLQRIGRKNQPHFRAVVTDARNATKSGKFVEVIGSYNPKAGSITIDKERALYWIGKGALPSDTMHNFFISEKIIEGKKRNVLPKKTYVKPVVEEKAPAPVVEAPKEEVVAETPKEEAAPAPEVAKEEPAPVVEEAAPEVTPEAPAPEVKEEAPSETPAEEPKAEETPAA
ncbi:MAG: 30S ribosomal protein S16 [Candidatus Pacebacteria bacterium]|jgi:small subunit ribosomal protein S16|nr:30S ribosomal protein S16 [Candidatus Paceibacterota bacterium]